jgi:pyruvate ferredoxin oxidoreductase gamma subunit
MIEIRFHGRGGHGSVISAEILALAAFRDGKFSQAFPRFGGERRGAPVEAFVRIDDKPIRLKSQVYSPEYVIVLDTSLFQVVEILHGIKPEGKVLVNSEMSTEDLGIPSRAEIITFPATKIALAVMGVPISNTAILGAFVAISGLVSMDALEGALHERFPANMGEKNIEAARRAYAKMRGRL